MVKVMGSDQRIVRCARVSHNRDDRFDPIRDRKLLRYLFVHNHASPFEHCVIAFKTSSSTLNLIRDKINNPAIPIYYSKGFGFITLRGALSSLDLLPHYIQEAVKDQFPFSYELVRKKGNIADKELERIPMSEDRKEPEWVEEVNAGRIGLIDKMELGTSMDYYTFIVECPIFVARQWMRHRFGAYNEVSRRYVSYEPEFFIPKELRVQDTNNKQASKDERINTEKEKWLIGEIKRITDEAKELYNYMVNLGVAKEIARGILPQSLMTKFYWTVPRIALDNFITLRTHEGAQKEIREFALVIARRIGYKGTNPTRE